MSERSVDINKLAKQLARFFPNKNPSIASEAISSLLQENPDLSSSVIFFLLSNGNGTNPKAHASGKKDGELKEGSASKRARKRWKG